MIKHRMEKEFEDKSLLKTISIVIPCYNEEKRLPPTLRRILNYMKTKKDINFEVIVVDDGSIDNTVRVVKEFNKEIPNLKIIQNDKNRGKGFSVKNGVANCNGDFVLFIDSDSSTDIFELDNFLPYIEDYDIIIGSRHIKENSVIIRQSLIRRMAGYFAHMLIRNLITSEVKDTMCGFKLFNKNAMILFDKQMNNRWGFDYELLYLAKKFNFSIKEIPVNWKDDKMSKVTSIGYINSLFELFKIRINDFIGRYNDSSDRSI